MLNSILGVHLEKPSFKVIRAIWPLSSDSWGNAQHRGIIRHRPGTHRLTHIESFGSDGQKGAVTTSVAPAERRNSINRYWIWLDAFRARIQMCD